MHDFPLLNLSLPTPPSPSTSGLPSWVIPTSAAAAGVIVLVVISVCVVIVVRRGATTAAAAPAAAITSVAAEKADVFRCRNGLTRPNSGGVHNRMVIGRHEAKRSTAAAAPTAGGVTSVVVGDQKDDVCGSRNGPVCPYFDIIVNSTAPWSVREGWSPYQHQRGINGYPYYSRSLGRNPHVSASFAVR